LHKFIGFDKTQFSYSEHFIHCIYNDFQVVCTQQWVFYWLSTLQMIGILVGSAIGGQLSDAYGRKPVGKKICKSPKLFSDISILLVSDDNHGC